jgi:hypothetical protein
MLKAQVKPEVMVSASRDVMLPRYRLRRQLGAGWITIKRWEDVTHGNKRAKASRNKGAQNKVSAVASGESRLDYMLRIMRDRRQKTSVRIAMAKAAAPYFHPRLLAVEHWHSAKEEEGEAGGSDVFH